VQSGSAMVTGDNLRNVNTVHVQALESMLRNMSYSCRAGRGRQTFFTFLAFCTTFGECCGLCASEGVDSWKRTGRKVCALLWHMTVLGKLGFGVLSTRI